MFAKYAPEFPCLTKGIVNAGERQAEAFRGFTLHIVLETLPNQPRPYDAAATSPASARTAARTACTCRTRRGARATRSATSRTSTTASTSRPARAPPGWCPTSSSAPAAGTPEESDLLRSLLGPVLGVSAADVPDLGLLLVGPMARGAEVSLR